MLRRREALALPAALLSQGLVNAAALTQPMPYVLVVPTPAGGPVDRVARALAPELSLALEGAPVVVDNRPGAAGKIGVQAARRAAREEGLFVGASSGASLAAVSKKLPDIPAKAKVLTFSYDTGERYLSVNGLFPAQE